MTLLSYSETHIDDCLSCKYLDKYKHNAYIILNFVCRECERGNVKNKGDD